MKAQHKKVILDKPKEQNSYYQQSSQLFDELVSLIDAHPQKYSQMLNARGRARDHDSPMFKHLNDWINEVTAFALSDSIYTTPTKCYWILHDLREFPSCEACGKHDIHKGKNVHLWSGYSTTCSKKCMQQLDSTKQHRRHTCQKKHGVDNVWQSEQSKQKAADTKLHRHGDNKFTNRQKAKQTVEKHKAESSSYYADIYKKRKISCLKSFGYENAAQCPAIHSKTHKKYMYNNMMFDSSIEVEYFIWMIDTGHDIKRASTSFKYEFNGKAHFYIPDFYLSSCNMFIEVKGDQFFNEHNGTMIIPWRHKSWTDEQYLLRCQQEEAKHQCMIHNNVKILRQSSEEIQAAHAYVVLRYGKNYVKQFRYDRSTESK